MEHKHMRVFVKPKVQGQTLVLPHVSFPTSSASFGSSVIKKLSKIVPDLTCREGDRIIFLLGCVSKQMPLNYFFIHIFTHKNDDILTIVRTKP